MKTKLTLLALLLGILAGFIFGLILILTGCAGTGDYAGMSKAQWNDYERRYWSKENHW